MSKRNDSIPLYVEFKPKSKNQHNYIRTISENTVTLCHGPAGSGKTTCSVGLASEYLSHGKVQRIIITRPVVEASDSGGLGYLPGDFHEKLHPYLIPILEELYKFLGPKDVYFYMNKREQGIAIPLIEVVPLEYMRGRSFHNAFVILDEAQNATLKQIKMFLTRLGTNTKAVLNGDTSQTDLKDSGFDYVISKLTGCPNVGVVQLEKQDIVRNKVICDILERL